MADSFSEYLIVRRIATKEPFKAGSSLAPLLYISRKAAASAITNRCRATQEFLADFEILPATLTIKEV